jgi:transposase-like protein
MQESRRSRRRVLSPEEQWEMFLEVTSQDLTQADVARKWEVDVSVVIRIRRQVKDAALEACEFTVVFGVTEPRLDRCLTFSVDLTTEIGL